MMETCLFLTSCAVIAVIRSRQNGLVDGGPRWRFPARLRAAGWGHSFEEKLPRESLLVYIPLDRRSA
jgi:hypothetical protein